MVVDCILCSDGDSRRFFSLRNFAWDCLLAEFLNKKFWRVLIQIFILFAVVVVFADIATMFVYQQRFSFSLVS